MGKRMGAPVVQRFEAGRLEVKSRVDDGKKVALVCRWTGTQKGYSAKARKKVRLLAVEEDSDIVLVWFS